MKDTVEPLLTVILGPTASGKTSLSMHLAERFGGEIASCDSVAVYRGMDLGSAKPSAQARACVPHHMIDVTTPDASYSAGDYSRDARAAIEEITRRGNLPIVTGGTGLYLRALLEGLFAGPKRSETLRARLRASAAQHGMGWLHRLLTRLDPVSAARIHANDEPKIIRAIEVKTTARQTLTEALAAPGARDPISGYRILRIGLQPDRIALYARINQRAGAMFAAGLIDETRALLDRYGSRPAPLSALGYRQAMQVIDGELSVDAAIEAAQQGHRNYAKRQMTWFRREPDVVWLAGFGDDPAVIAQAEELVADKLQ